jgi:superfamily II DNA/RNA helicase
MADFRDQLAAIRPIITKVEPVASDSHRPTPPKMRPVPSKARTASAIADKYIGRLPFIGRIDRIGPKGDYGFIAAERKKDFFFHISGMLPDGNSKITEELRNRTVVFAIGSSPKDVRVGAVQWCLADDIEWEGGHAPATQLELDQIRTKWFARQDLRRILNILGADWYKGAFKDGKPLCDLADSILHKALEERLKVLVPEEWCANRVPDALKLSRFAFLEKWNWQSDSYFPEQLLIAFAPDQLVTLGHPRYNWLYVAPPKLKPKLFEWALRFAWGETPLGKWAVDLRHEFPWDGDVAARLLRSGKDFSSVATEWLNRQKDAGRLPLEPIRERLLKFPAEWDVWFEYLPDLAKVDVLASRGSSDQDVASFVASRSDPGLEIVAIRHYAIAIDIESDGDRIWEIGVAKGPEKALLLDRVAPVDHLDKALGLLDVDLKKSILVIGHNILSWDWPILSRYLPEVPKPVIWDTLLVAFMLEPWKPTHALGGSHHADSDAADTLALFERQIARLGNHIGLRLLKRSISSTFDLMQAIGDALQSVDWKLPALPIDLPAGARALRPNQLLVAPDHWLRRFDWVPNVTVVSASEQEALDIDYLAIEGKPLDNLLSQMSDEPLAATLKYVLRKAESCDVSVRFASLPVWIRDHEQLSHSIRSVTSAVDAGCYPFAVAPYPQSATWYTQLLPEKHVFLDPPAACFVSDMRWMKASELPKAVQKQLLLSGDAPRTGVQYRASAGRNPAIDLWIRLDPAAKQLSKSGSCFHTFVTVDALQGGNLEVVRTPSPPMQKPRLLIRDDTTLFPGAEDQATYWKSVIAGLRAASIGHAPGTVSILLVSSSACRELLALVEECLVELSLARSYAAHHSRRERLVRAAGTPGACLVDLIDHWPEWLALSELSGVHLCPVIEALPINEWFATAQRDAPIEVSFGSDVDAPDEPDNERDEPGEAVENLDPDDGVMPLSSSLRISGADIAARTPELVAENLVDWLTRKRIAEHVPTCVVVDPRISLRHREVRQTFQSLEQREIPFSDEEEHSLDRIFELLTIPRQDAPSDYESMRTFLEKNWNIGKKLGDPDWISDFREDTQRPAIEAIRDRSADVLVTLPTGEGKSVLFQVPALCRGLMTRRLSIVISPLRALMRDQVQRLWMQGFHQSVDYLTADRPIHEIDDVYQGVLDHRIVLLYVAPERFRSRRFIDVVGRRFDSDHAFEYVIVDEAHCVSQWGYEFRPDYFFALTSICLKYRLSSSIEKSPFILLSATVTASNREHLSELTKGDSSNSGTRYLEFKARPDQYFHPIRSHISIDPKALPGRINTRPKADWPIEPRIDVIAELIREAKRNKTRTGQQSALIVFVSRRDHAEELALLIAEKKLKVEVDYFHAGLDAETREEVYRRFLDGAIDVLVATKAFGMGMDIPHIHWAVHLAPPTFLEDYLQEVGRIGRGKGARERAQLDQLTATLLYSSEDFEANRTGIQRNRIELLHISDLYSAIRENGKLTEDGILVTMMPDAGFMSFNSAGERRGGCVQVRKMIYWLERTGRVEILAMMPGLLPVRLKLERLSGIAENEKGPVADVARLLVILSEQKNSGISRSTGETSRGSDTDRTILDRIIDGLSSFIGFFLGSRQEPAVAIIPAVRNEKASNTRLASPGEAIINLGQIWRDTSLRHIDDVLSTIADLEERGAIEITRTITFSRRRYSHAPLPQIDAMFEWLSDVALRILNQLRKDSQYIIDFGNIATGFPEFQVNGELIDVQTSFERAICYLLRSCGVRIRESLVDDQRELVATLSNSQHGKVIGRVKSVVSATHELWRQFVPRLAKEIREIEISALLMATRRHAGSRRFRESDLRRNLGLLASLKLVSVSEPLVPMSYVLSVHRTDVVLNEDDHPEVWAELDKVNRLTELRGDAIEVFVHLPNDARAPFIEGYFKQTTPEEMEEFLNQQLGLIEEDDAEGAGRFVQEKREHLRAQAVQEFFSKYQDAPEEPNQWRAISHPFDRHLLVNAGPGSGKTSVLIARIAHLIREQHLRPEEILVLAFNRAVVFEIRARIRELFGKLGYGAYVRRLDVSTFHSFATRHLGRVVRDTDDWKTDRETLLNRFADRLEADNTFRLTVGGGLRAILVDEFQDANDDIFRIVRSISSISGRNVGVMVIGDDDQDILRWNRAGRESSEIYFQRFQREYALADDQELALSVNFRSGPGIVKQSQQFLGQFFGLTDGHSVRLKTSELRAASWAKDAFVDELVSSGGDFASALSSVAPILTAHSLGERQSVAILCRTNHEVATAFHALRPACPDLAIQNNVSYPISRLRHIGLWADLLRSEVASGEGDRPLSDAIFGCVQTAYLSLDIPEVREPRPEDVTPKQLWELCRNEMSYPYLSHLIEFVEGVDSEDVIRLLGRQTEKIRAPIVSTIHKVKGLEFDRVIVLPSSSRFPMSIGYGGNIIDDATEDARLLYVAMTRAKTYLTYYIGGREAAWLSLKTFQGEDGNGKVLSGNPAEVAISWAWESSRFNNDAQSTLDYIERNVRTGDRLLVG